MKLSQLFKRVDAEEQRRRERDAFLSEATSHADFERRERAWFKGRPY